MHTLFNSPDLAPATSSASLASNNPERTVFITGGARHLAERSGAAWLFEEIARSIRDEPTVANEPIQVWRLAVRSDCSATLSCSVSGTGAVFTKELMFTDVQLPELTLWTIMDERGGGRVTIMLPVEY